MATGDPARFMTLADAADVLNISATQIYALVRRGELRAIKIGGRGQWRVEATALQQYIDAAYLETERFIQDHPFEGDETSTTAKTAGLVLD